MDIETFHNIFKIIERDSKTTTYKLALLRGVIEIIQENSPFINYKKDRVYYPIGLLVDKWILYYYPLLESDTPIPQINGKSKLAFESHLYEIISAYNEIGGFSAFYNDFKNKVTPNSLNSVLINLTKKIRDTITRMPMKYIGRSISNEYYSIFDYENKIVNTSISSFDRNFLIREFGIFSIPVSYHNAFKLFGNFINGQDSILFKWAEFSVSASKESVSFENAVKRVIQSPISERDVAEAKKTYSKILLDNGSLRCVWTGKEVRNFDVDHLIPFSVWKNNDLWNLLPSDSKINNQKRDKIPSPVLIDLQKDLILEYWNILHASYPSKFISEIKTSLVSESEKGDWKTKAIDQIIENCNYLISIRGYQEWTI